MMVTTATADNNKNFDVQRILRYESSYSLDDLIMRSYPSNPGIKRDIERFKSINDILDLLEEIENLRLRASCLTDVQLESSPDVIALKNDIFGPNNS